METLKELVERLNLKPSTAELKFGRSINKNGTSYVEVFNNNNGEKVYTTYKDYQGRVTQYEVKE